MTQTVLSSKSERDEIERRVVKWIRDRVNYSQEINNKPYTFYRDVSFFDYQLPSVDMQTQSRNMYKIIVIDEDMLSDLEDSHSLNWLPHSTQLFPVCVSKDGNCLLHAASVAVWGVEDSQNTLRDLMLMTVKNNHSFKKRWWSQLVRNLQSLEISQPEVFNQEWDDVIRSISDLGSSSLSVAVPHCFLEGIHIYILANILRRPVIIVTNGTAKSLTGLDLQENHIGGLYLPLEWPPIECCKTPIILGYSFSHFCPLVSRTQPNSKSSQERKDQFMFPLVNSDLSFLSVRYLKEDEEGSQAWDLVQSYLLIKEVDILENSGNVTKAPFAQMHLRLWEPGQNILFENAKPAKKKQTETVFLKASYPQSHVPERAAQQSNHPFYDIEMNSQTELVPMRTLQSEHHKNIQINEHQWMSKQERKKMTPNLCITEGCNKKAATYLDQFCKDCFRVLTEAKNSAGQIRDNSLINLIEGSADKSENNQHKQISGTTLNINEGHVVVPTAPLMSLEPEIESDPPLSMMNDRCVNKCGYRCSVQTYPYCHECYRIEMSRKEDESHRNAVPLVPSEILITESRSENSPVKTVQGLVGHKEFDINHTLNSLPSHPSTHPIWSSTHLTNSGESWQLGTEDNIYLFELLDQPTKNLQQELVIVNHDSKKFENSSGTSNQKDHNTINNSSASSSQMETQDQIVPGKSDIQKERTISYVEKTSEWITEGFPEIDVKNTTGDVVVSEEPSCNVKCASPFCQTLIRQQEKLCNICTDILKQGSKQHSVRNSEPEAARSTVEDHKTSAAYVTRNLLKQSSSLHPFQKLRGEPCVTLNCPNYGDPHMDDKCSSCYFQYKHLAKTKGNNESVAWSEKTTGLPIQIVSEHPTYKNVSQLNASPRRKEQFRHTQQVYKTSPVDTQQVYKTSPVHTQQVLDTRYVEARNSNNVPEMYHRIQNYSNSHQTFGKEPSMLSVASSKLSLPEPKSLIVTSKSGHNSYESLHLPPDSSFSFKKETEDSFEKTFQGIENTWRSSARKCAEVDCQNYGNRDNEGFCNACYRVIVRQRHLESETQKGIDVPDATTVDCI